jgi:hypothetical protein
MRIHWLLLSTLSTLNRPIELILVPNLEVPPSLTYVKS